MAWQDSAVPADQPTSSPPGWQANAIPADQPQSSTDDSILSHLHNFAQGFTAATRVATDAPTFGLMDKLLGPQAQADTAAAYKQMGGWSIPLSLAGGLATGGPELKGASMLGEALGGGRIGAALGGGAVGAGTGGLGAYGHEAGWTPDAGDIGKGATIGAVLNAAAGALSGPAVEAGQVGPATGRSFGRMTGQFTPPALPTSPSAQSYFDAAEQAYKPLTGILYDGTKEVDPALDLAAAKNAVGDLNGFKWKNEAPKTKTEIDNITGQAQISADALHTVQKNLDEIMGNPNANASDKLYARYFSDQLQGVFENGLPQAGVPANLPPGVSPSNYAAAAKAEGDFLTGQGRDMQRADVWKSVGATAGGKDIGAQAGSWLSDQAARAAANKPGVWAPPGSPYYDAANELAKTTSQPTPLSWYAKHFFLTPMAMTAAGEGLNALSGGEGMGHQPWWARLGEEAAAGVALGAGTAGYRAFTGATNVAEQQAAEAALRQTIASRTMQNPAGAYTPLSPITAPTAYRNALRMLLLGQSGRY